MVEINEVVKQTEFRGSYNIQQIELGNLLIWLRIELKKNKLQLYL